MSCGQPVGAADNPGPAPPPGDRRRGEPAGLAARPPRHIAERILRARSGMIGERKSVTVLFVDIKGSTGLIDQRDPEEARQILGPALDAMTAAVHRFDGVVSKALGDGLMALFGAPLALEDHALRACHAALAMRQAIQQHAARLRAEHGLELQARIGLNSGEVVVLGVGTDLHMDYDAVGATVHLAARMEHTALPGTIRLTGGTARLLGDRMRLHDLGPVPVNGFREPIHVFELEGVNEAAARCELADESATPLVGRTTELRVLEDAAGQAGRGQGRAILLSGEAGIGKSRLCAEMVERLGAAGWLVLTARAAHHEATEPWLPVRRMLLAHMGLTGGDGPRVIAERVDALLRGRDPTLSSGVPGVLDLLGVPLDHPEWRTLTPDIRRRRTIDACRGWLWAESRIRPVLVLVDDLQWVDSETEAFVRAIAEAANGTAVLLLLTTRDGRVPEWAHRESVVEMRLAPLANADGLALLDEILGTGADRAEVKQHLVARGGGNPLYLTEIVRALTEAGTLVGRPGDLRVVRAIARDALPPTVQAIIAARIDDLAGGDKDLLQAAAVIGQTFEVRLLADVVAGSEDEVRAALGRLQERGFVREWRMFPELEFAFRHPLALEVAYRSLLKDRRRDLHRRVVDALGRASGAAGPVAVGRLAHHAFEAELWQDAVPWCRQAALQAVGQSAYPEAAVLYRRALEALGRSADAEDRAADGIDLRIELRHALFPLGRFGEIATLLEEARVAAEALSDSPRLCTVLTYATADRLGAGRHRDAIESGERALAIAEQLGDRTSERDVLFQLVQAHASVGEYARASARARLLLDQAVERPHCPPATLTVASLVRMWLVWCLAETGAFPEARRQAETALTVAQRVAQPFPTLLAHLGRGLVGLRQGAHQEAAVWLEVGLSLSERPELKAWRSAVASPLGLAWAHLGRVDDALALLEQVVVQTVSSRGSGHALRLVNLGEAYLVAGRLADAREAADKALASTQAHGEQGHEAYARSLQAKVAAASGATAAAVGAMEAAAALAERLGMKPLLAHALARLGDWTEAAGDAERARTFAARAAALAGELQLSGSPGEAVRPVP